MKTKTVYRCSVRQGKNYWVASPQYASMEDKAKQYAELCKFRDGREYAVAKLI